MSKARSGKKVQRHDPLEKTLDTNVGVFRARPHSKHNRVREEDPEGEQFLSGNLSKKLLKAVAEQRKELIDEDVILTHSKLDKQVNFDNLTDKALLTGDFDDENDDIENVDDVDFELEDDDEDGEDYNYDVDIDMSPEDREALEMFLPSVSGLKNQNLGNVVMQKIREREQASRLGFSMATVEGEEEARPSLHPKLINVYQKVGTYLKKYRSGKIPKPFKMISTLKNWEEVLYYTNPMEWSPQATNAAVRLFSATFNPKMAQRFYSLVLVPKIQAEVEATGRLGYHLYDSLKRSIYKPTAFFKGIILPMAAQGNNMKEAVVYASVLSRVSIPNMHAAVTLLQLAKLRFNAIACLFMRVLLNKKFSLPVPVLSAVTEYFFRCINDGEDYPVLWYRTLLSFVQRYKYSLTSEQAAMIKAVLKKKRHHILSDEIRRELFSVQNSTSISAAAVIEEDTMC